MVLKKQIKEIEELISYHQISNKNISSGGVDWHLDHVLRVVNGVSSALKNSDPLQYKWRFNWKRSYIFILGFIPRGKARAPKTVVAEGDILKEDLIAQVEKAKARLELFANLADNSYFNHPFFGDLNKRRTIKFLEIHTDHHLKIIKDILQK